MISGETYCGLSRSQMILIETFSSSLGQGLSKTAQFGSFAVSVMTTALALQASHRVRGEQLWAELQRPRALYLTGMGDNATLLCIHRDPAQLTLLQENGYELLTATTGHEGLRLFASQPVDAIVLEYHLGLLDGTFVASEIKRLRPTIPIVMLADNLELPDG